MHSRLQDDVLEHVPHKWPKEPGTLSNDGKNSIVS